MAVTILSVNDLWKAYVTENGTVPAVRGVSFNIDAGKVYTLLGPSGCGKSTVLRCIAGLERPDQGKIEIGGQIVFSSASGKSVPAYQRDIGMVFQSYAIWPHMTVFDNVAFALVEGKRKYSKQEIIERVDWVLRILHLEGISQRFATLLSGGQQQRVALARALVYQPALLLLDEPLSNLDAALRDEVRREIRGLVETLHLTVLYVTHDQIEGLSLSTCVAVMRDGIIVQEGSPEDIYVSPKEAFVGGFVGTATQVIGTLVERDKNSGICLVQTPLGQMRGLGSEKLSNDDKITLSIRPEQIKLHIDKPDIETNVFEAKVKLVLFTGAFKECMVRIGDIPLEVKVPSLTDIKDDQKVYVEFPCKQCLIL